MKKTIFSAAVCAVITSNVFAGPFGDLGKTLNAFDSSAPEVVEGNIPEGQDLLPIIYRYTHDEVVLGEKIIAATVTLNVANPLEDVYEIESEEYFKYGIGNQCQASVYTVKKVDGKFQVVTSSVLTYSADKKCNKTGEPIAGSAKKMNANSKNVVAALEEMFGKTKDDEYKKWEEAVYSDVDIYRSAAKFAPNRIKAKKWYDSHPLEGKTVEIKFAASGIKESKKQGYSYELSGMLWGTIDTIVHFYSNNDEYADLKTGSAVTVKGKVSEVRYSPERAREFRIEAIHVAE